MPGLINTHTHTPMTVLRGYGDDMTLDEWLNKSIWPWEKKHVNLDTVRANSSLAIIEMIRAGTTTFADMYFYGTATAPLANEIGMRAVLGEAYAEGGPYSFDHTVQATGELMEQYADDPLVTISVVPHSAYACTREQLLKCAEMADEYGAPLHTHLSETLDETETVVAQTGMRPVAYLESLGLLTTKMVAVHCIHINSNEMGLLAERGVSVSHTPQSGDEARVRSRPHPGHARARAHGRARHGRGGEQQHPRHLRGDEGRSPPPQGHDRRPHGDGRQDRVPHGDDRRGAGPGHGKRGRLA